ncbi:MAG: DNA-processing protein DprA [Bacteroidaceae bacterium]|nr:DNA-processing protein DprA [Bacteroidaceae bacterium]
MTEHETLCTMALSRVPGINLSGFRYLLEQTGSAAAVYEHRNHIRDVVPDLNPRSVEGLAVMDSLMSRAEEELRFAQRSHIRCLGLNDDDYPARLRECPDAPILLYYLGTADLNACRVVSMVGTRRITPYGRDLCARFVADLRTLSPDTLVVSGLAYGVDIHCHRAAMSHGLPTVGVLAHGLDQIYPRMHRPDAERMLECGGLLTEFMSRTNADKKNFVQRNRIVAGMCDAVVVVESARKGGSLITAEIADAYHRDVFAFPGRVGDLYSEGCNELLRRNRASMLTSAEDFLQTMGWATDDARRQQLRDGIQQDLFPQLSAEEQTIVEALRDSDGLQVNMLSTRTGIPIGSLTSLLFGLEMKGVVRTLCGGVYRLTV